MNEMTNSHILVHEFGYLQPTTVEAALDLLRQHGDRARVLAGGTDLIVQIKMERLTPQFLIDINSIAGLDGIAVQDGVLRMGARTSIRATLNDARIQRHYPALAEACGAFSTTQVQVMGTIGGNLCNGSPASDSAPALIAFDAQVILQSAQGERSLALEEFFLGPGRTALRSDELLTAVVLERPLPGSGSAFSKISRVAADIAKANAAALLVREKEDTISDCRLVFGSVAPTPMRAKKAEDWLRGQLFGPELVAEAARLASEEVVPIDDVRSTAWYRREIVRVLAHDALNKAWQRAGRVASNIERGPSQLAGEVPESRSDGRQPRTRDVLDRCEVQLAVNGEKHHVWVAPNDLLLNVLREKLELTGAKYGCGIGECGACTVQIDGKPALSCLVLAVAVDGSDIVTVEGLQGLDGELDPLQDAFIEHQAFQCGYCTSGVLMMSKSLLAESPQPSETDVREYLKGNLCRCTGYSRIVRAVMSSVDAEVGPEAALS